MSNSNPFTSAFRAAYSELTSDQAKEFYAQRAVEDFHATIGVITALGMIAFYLGQQCRQMLEPSEPTAVALYFAPSTALISDNFCQPIAIVSVSAVQPKGLPTYQPIALLPAARDAATTRVSDSVNRLNMTVKELRAMAKQKGVRGFSKMSKATILSLLAA
jgi:hypothetical protein